MAFFEAFPYFPATVIAIRDESPRAKTFTLDVLTEWTYKAGQHCVIRLTDENGYMAARDYSLSSAPSSGKIEITVGHAFMGEVSGWLFERIKVGDSVEISKPLGENFSWNPQDKSPLLLVAGGIGVAPLMGIVREHRLTHAETPLALAYSLRSNEDLCFSDELAKSRDNEQIEVWITRDETKGNQRAGRITAESLAPLLSQDQRIYICGPTAFVDSMELLLTKQLRLAPEQLFTERFG